MQLNECHSNLCKLVLLAVQSGEEEGPSFLLSDHITSCQAVTAIVALTLGDKKKPTFFDLTEVLHCPNGY